MVICLYYCHNPLWSVTIILVLHVNESQEDWAHTVFVFSFPLYILNCLFMYLQAYYYFFQVWKHFSAIAMEGIISNQCE